MQSFISRHPFFFFFTVWLGNVPWLFPSCCDVNDRQSIKATCVVHHFLSYAQMTITTCLWAFSPNVQHSHAESTAEVTWQLRFLSVSVGYCLKEMRAKSPDCKRCKTSYNYHIITEKCNKTTFLFLSCVTSSAASIKYTENKTIRLSEPFTTDSKCSFHLLRLLSSPWSAFIYIQICVLSRISEATSASVWRLPSNQGPAGPGPPPLLKASHAAPDLLYRVGPNKQTHSPLHRQH